jgi:hypothetical protein
MSNQKHTPGPWEMWTSNSFRRISGPDGRDGGVLCAITQCRHGHPDLHFGNGGFNGPDARLILAAPELAKEIESAIRRLDWFLDANPDHVDSTLNVIRSDLRAALAKATGEAA